LFSGTGVSAGRRDPLATASQQQRGVALLGSGSCSYGILGGGIPAPPPSVEAWLNRGSTKLLDLVKYPILRYILFKTFGLREDASFGMFIVVISVIMRFKKKLGH